MTCWRIENLIAPFLDDELPDAEAGAVADHLEHCAACHRKVEEIAALPEITAPDVAETAAPLLEGFEDALRDRIALSDSLLAGTTAADESRAWGVPAAPPAPAAPRTNTNTWLAVAALGLLVALVGWSWLTQQRIEQLEQSLADRDAIIKKLEQRVVAGSFDVPSLPDAAGGDAVPVFLPSAAPTPQTLPAGAFAPVSYGMASIDSPRMVR